MIKTIYNCLTKQTTHVQLTHEELATMQSTITWHYEECPIRVTFSDEIKLMWLDKHKENELLGTYPEISALLDYVKLMSSKRVVVNGETHIYLEEIYPEHKAIIESNGAIIETKPVI